MTDNSAPQQTKVSGQRESTNEAALPSQSRSRSLLAEEGPLVIGVGSSAGGLEAVRELVSNLPTNVNCAYVIVQHMSPQHKSLMTTLIASETKLNVVDATDGVRPQPNTVYVTPPRNDIIIDHGRLKLVDYDHGAGKPKPSVNRFLTSLAEDQGNRSMGIILSGTGSDGAYGVQSIREVGGITIAQDDVSAKYDGMANAAIETGCVDLVLRPREIGTHLMKILDTARDFENFRGSGKHSSHTSSILQIVLARTRVDFRDYKQTTVLRRIERRMTALGIGTPEEYVEHCRQQPREVDALFKDLLISVTRFFRDKHEFEELQVKIKEIVKNKGDAPLRIWVAGCATGEEVYSIAMLLADAMGGAAELVHSKTQIFATDIDRAALEIARRGFYPQAAAYDVPKDFAEKYFTHQESGVRVLESLRSVILFSDHNLCQDPPFLNIDLICCRNLLIYFGAKLQAKVLARLHYSMNAKALIFVGTAESVTGADQLFVPATANAHIYSKRILRTNSAYERGTLSSNKWTGRNSQTRRDRAEVKETAKNADRVMFDDLVRGLGDNAVLVSHDFAFLRVYGDISSYIEMTEGSPLNLQLSLLKSPYREEARSLVTLALKHGKKRIGGQHITDGPIQTIVRLEAMPVKSDDTHEQMAVLVINEQPARPEEIRANIDFDTKASQLNGKHLQELDLELAHARDALQQMVEELETSNEELQGLNEELQATNEEMQATNEELETSNEELQSTNEELITVNEEMQVNSAELMALNAKLGSVLGNVPMPLLVIDTALQITSASHDAMKIFKISMPLKSPHLSQINLPSGFPKIVEIANQALQTGEPLTMSFESEGRLYNMQCAPFTGEVGQLIGTTMVFTGTPTQRALAEQEHVMLQNAPLHALRFDANGTVEHISRQTADALGFDVKRAQGLSLTELFSNTNAKMRGHSVPEILLKGQETQFLLPLGRKSKGLTRWASVERYIFDNPETGNKSTVVVGSDVTEILQSKDHQFGLNDELVMALDISGVGHWTMNTKTGALTWSDKVYDIHGLSPDSYTPDINRAIDFYHPEDRADVRAQLEHVQRTGESRSFQKRIHNANGKLHWVQVTVGQRLDATGEPSHIIGTFRDVSENVWTETMFQQLQQLNLKEGVGFISFDVLTQHSFWCPTAYNIFGFDETKEAGFGALIEQLHPEDVERFAQLRQNALTSAAPFDMVVRLQGEDGRETKVAFDVDTAIDSSGKCVRYFGTVRRQ